MTGSHRPIRRRRPTPQRSPSPEGQTNARLARLCAALGIVLAAFCLKLAFPLQTEAWLRDTLGGGIDLRESVSAIGAGLRDVFRPSGEDSPADHAPSGEDRVPAEAEPNDPQPVPEETPEPLPSPEPSPSPEPEPLALRSVGRLTFDDQLMSAAARPVVALENGVLVIDPEEDDAPPIPFDMTVPEKADYTRHELPFAYASPLAPDAARTSGFGYRLHPIDRVTKFHYGIDLAAAAGTPVYSFAGGRVAATGQNSSYGHYVLVEHAGGYATLYAHLSEITVKAGAEVGMGDRIGRAGQTGKATGPHLHFELRGNGKLIDPAPYL